MNKILDTEFINIMLNKSFFFADSVALNAQVMHPTQSTEHSRLHTFSAWSKDIKIQPEKLAKAGFFYTGIYIENN